MTVTPTRPRPPQPWPWNPDLVTDAFTCGDCWLLARTLVELYEGMTLCVLAIPDQEEPEGYDWCHVLAKDARTGRYIDIEGEHTFEDLVCRWDWAGWEELIEDVAPEIFSHMPRAYPEVSVEVGVQRLLRDTTWEPPSLRGKP